MKNGGGVGKVAHVGYWSQTVAIDILLCFYFAVVFSLMYFRFRQLKQINLDRHSLIPLANIRHLPHPPWFPLQTTEYTEQQQSLSGVHSIMRVKLAQAGEGGGGRPPPLPSPVKLQCTLQLSGQIHLPCFISSKNMYSVLQTTYNPASRVSSKQTKINLGSNQNKICFAFVSVCFVKPKRKNFGLFRCFEPILKQLKQTDLFHNKPKQP